MNECPIEDRLAIHDLLVAHAHAVDELRDIDAVCALFTPDAQFDLSGVGFPTAPGHAGIAGFYRNAFEAVAAQAHYLSNFAITAFSGSGGIGDTASVRAYVTGMARYKAGGGMTMHGRYYYDVIRSPDGWKATRFTMDVLIPAET